MNILFFCPFWGQEHLGWDQFLKNVKDAGYDGVEASLPFDQDEKIKILNLLNEYGLLFIGQHWETVERDFDQHLEQYRKRLLNLVSSKPMFINSQTGKDYYTFGQNAALISLAQKISDDEGIPIIHETHRGKFSFAAHITREYLHQIEDLRITLDISHWCNTAETFLHDQPEAVELAITRTDHIHSRVGYTQGPQITDPQAPEWKEAMDFHLDCWDKIVALKREQGVQSLSITTEFGAPPYLPLLPYTQQPIVDQWLVNIYMKNLLKKRYNLLK